MEKPIETRTLSRIAGIFLAAGIGMQSLLTVFRAPLRLLNRGNPVELSASGTVLLLVTVLLYVPLLVLAFREAKQEAVTHQTAVRTGILTLVLSYGMGLVSLLVQVFSRIFLDMGDYAGITIVSNFTRIFNFCYGAAIALLVCAAAVDLYATSRRNPGITRKLALVAIICAGACLVLKCTAIFFPAKWLYGASADLMLPMKWKAVLLVQVLAEIVPIGILAVWCWCSPKITRLKALSKVILAPVLYSGIGVILELVNRYVIQAASMGGMEVLSAYGVTESYVSFFSLIGTAAFLLICCAGAIELYHLKYPPSDGIPKEEPHA